MKSNFPLLEKEVSMELPGITHGIYGLHDSSQSRVDMEGVRALLWARNLGQTNFPRTVYLVAINFDNSLLLRRCFQPRVVSNIVTLCLNVPSSYTPERKRLYGCSYYRNNSKKFPKICGRFDFLETPSLGRIRRAPGQKCIYAFI